MYWIMPQFHNTISILGYTMPFQNTISNHEYCLDSSLEYLHYLQFQDDIAEVVRRLQRCAQKKVYLQEFCAVAVCQLIGWSPVGVVREHLVPLLELERGWEGCTPELLYTILHLNKLYSKVDTHSTLIWQKYLLG